MSERVQSEERRELLRRVARGIALVALGSGAGALVVRARSAETCERRHPCAACALRDDCRRPRRETSRKETP
jgi:hypothetical protein